MIAAVESILSQTEATEETKSLIRHQVSSLLMAHRPREVLSKVERDALRELKADKDLVIVPADKGRSTAVLDRTDYLQKAKGAITPTDGRMARPQDTALARFYGLPKVHKDGAPLRPIVRLKGTPKYGLAKWLFRRLKFLTAESDTTVSSSAQFLEKLKGDLAIETIELLLQSKYDETENRLGRAQVLQLLKFCLRTYFTFDGTIHEQVKGTPMGSPISGFIAETVLQRLESLVFQHHKPKFWARYVDDTFVVIDRDQLLTFKERLNAVFPDIQFTMKEKENNQLAILDVLVCRKDCGGLKTKVFREATNTMQVLNFNNNHPISHKRSCVRTLYRPFEKYCSEPEDKIAELQYLRRVFKANGYPRNFVNRCIRKRDERPHRTDTKVWRALPYVKNVSEAVGRLLAPLGVGVANRPEATIRQATTGDCALWRLHGSEQRYCPGPLPCPAFLRSPGALFGKSVLSKIDLVRAFRQSPIVLKDVSTAVTTLFSLFEFPCMSFGSRDACQDVQRFIDRVLPGLPFVYTYIDDLQVASLTAKEHMEHLATVFDRLQQFGVVRNPSKCVLGAPTLEFLDHLVDTNGIHPLPSKVAAFRDFPPPSSKRQLQRFLGMENFYRRFLPHCADTILRLTSLLSDPKRSFELSTNALCAALADATLLAHFLPILLSPSWLTPPMLHSARISNSTFQITPNP
ncbi:hypothetical protein SprV_0501868900 [Sparganum proliferum]